MADKPIVFNGIDGSTGGYLLTDVDHHAVARFARGEPEALDDEAHDALADIVDYADRTRGKSRGLMAGVDPRRLDQTGWGVIWPRYRGSGQIDGHDAVALNARVDAVRAALAPLIEHRRAQAAHTHAHRFRELEYPIGLPPGGAPRPASKHHFLAGLRPYVDGTMPADPDKLPYYLLIVGSPAHVPYRIQYQLDVQYAVGRLHFDTLDAYADYARAVVAAEAAVDAGAAPRARRVALWGPRTPGDRATALSADHLLTPLAGWLSDALFADPAFTGGRWTLDADDIAHGTRDRLAALLGGPRTPALAFTASHGLYYPPGDPRHRSHTGALLCHDWTPGTAPRAADLFAGDDLAADADLAGLVAFHFACYGAGLPAHDAFAPPGPDGARALGRPFVSRLPQRLLGRPDGALAVIGHVDRAWGASFYLDGPRGGAAQLTTFKSALRLLLEGHPVGHAMDPFGARYAATTSDIANAITQHRDEGHSDEYTDDAWMADRWLESNDARNYAVLGDPAVRLAVAPPEPAPEAIPEVAATPALAATLEALISALATTPLDVRTSTAPDVAAALADPARATLRAATRLAPDGGLDTVLDAALADDPAVAALHRALAAAAPPHRAATLDALARALAALRTPPRE